LWAEDECQFNLHGSSTRVWAPIGEQPRQLFAPTRNKVGYFGATSLDTGQMTYQRADSFNADSFKQFLGQILGAQIHIKQKVCLILDNARWHHAKKLKDFLTEHSERLELVFLPPYSPELNPQERVWRHTRRKATHNKYFNEIQELVSAVEKEFTRWTLPNDEL
jgi:transposase